jgi:hypothetical protein
VSNNQPTTTARFSLALALATCALGLGTGLGGCGGDQAAMPDFEPASIEVSPSAALAGRTIRADLIFVPADVQKQVEAKKVGEYFGGGDPLRGSIIDAGQAVTLRWEAGDAGTRLIGRKAPEYAGFWKAAEKSGNWQMVVLAQAGGLPIDDWRLLVPMGEDQWTGGTFSKDRTVKVTLTPAGPQLVEQPNKLD